MQRLLNSQRKIIETADVGLSSSFPKVGPEQVLGIEPCNLETGRGFFEVVCGQDSRPLDPHDPPPPTRESSPASIGPSKGERG